MKEWIGGTVHPSGRKASGVVRSSQRSPALPLALVFIMFSASEVSGWSPQPCVSPERVSTLETGWLPKDLIMFLRVSWQRKKIIISRALWWPHKVGFPGCGSQGAHFKFLGSHLCKQLVWELVGQGNGFVPAARLPCPL
uniref:Uncharacterized protein n=1 Tax=Myotis myotis TaxID=51298 RepID=A0A7J7YES5_MYOMY|nr:hypothetical protein mMyoMyo1_010952 [Myotis myotis]